MSLIIFFIINYLIFYLINFENINYILIFKLNIKFYGDGDWGLGIWGLGIGPNPQSPIPNPQSPILLILKKYY